MASVTLSFATRAMRSTHQPTQVFGEGEPEFKVIDEWRNVLEG